jgi:hypothetical protein
MSEMTELHSLLIMLEKKLLAVQVRSSRAELDALLADDFNEFGKSGKILDKADILEALPKESQLNIQATDFKFFPLADNIVQLTYRSRSQFWHEEAIHALRSSIWKKHPNGWKMIFHQGTVTSDSE